MSKLTYKDFPKGSRQRKFMKACNLDLETGYSDVVYYKDYPELKTENGGDWCRSDGTIGSVYIINRIKVNNSPRSPTIGVQLIGFNKQPKNRQIPSEIRSHFEGKPCRVLNTLSNVQLDHKDGRYDEFSRDVKTSDFQPLHKTVNLAKRSHCKKCKETGIKFDATSLGYLTSQWVGEPEYSGSCIGCYWYDPKTFNTEISKNYEKTR